MGRMHTYTISYTSIYIVFFLSSLLFYPLKMKAWEHYECTWNIAKVFHEGNDVLVIILKNSKTQTKKKPHTYRYICSTYPFRYTDRLEEIRPEAQNLKQRLYFLKIYVQEENKGGKSFTSQNLVIVSVVSIYKRRPDVSVYWRYKMWWLSIQEEGRVNIVLIS